MRPRAVPVSSRRGEPRPEKFEHEGVGYLDGDNADGRSQQRLVPASSSNNFTTLGMGLGASGLRRERPCCRSKSRHRPQVTNVNVVEGSTPFAGFIYPIPAGWGFLLPIHAS
jgi:hypothetical protein